MWRVYEIGAALNVGILPKVFNEPADLGSIRVPKDETTTSVLLDREKVQFFSKHYVVTFFRYLQGCLCLLLRLEQLNRLNKDNIFGTTAFTL